MIFLDPPKPPAHDLVVPLYLARRTKNTSELGWMKLPANTHQVFLAVKELRELSRLKKYTTLSSPPSQHLSLGNGSGRQEGLSALSVGPDVCALGLK